MFSLNLNSNEIEDISILSNFTMLNSLSLSDNHISDISGLSNLTNLTHLYLDDNNISDSSLEDIEKLPKLDVIFLSGNLIVDSTKVEELINKGLTIYYYYDNEGNQAETSITKTIQQ